MQQASRLIEGQRKPVTILFADIVESTSIAESLDPEHWKSILDGVHHLISQSIFRFEGTIAQLLGDGVLAFFGAPLTHEDDPLRALSAALEIQSALSNFAYKYEGAQQKIRLRIGINTGLVVVGSIGSDLHMEYLAVGDAVNLAARLQSAAGPGKILISENTARLVQAAYILLNKGEIRLKGRERPVNAFEVVRRRPVAESERGFEELGSLLVGRTKELSLLRLSVAALSRGCGGIVSLSGEAGIGKSRLVQEARRLEFEQDSGQRLVISSALRWIEGRALSYGQSISFWTIDQLIKCDLGLSDGDSELMMRPALKDRLDELFAEKTTEIYPYLASLLGISLERESYELPMRLDGEALKRQIILSVLRYFEQIARRQPLVLIFEDLHWADPSSVQTLQQLFTLAESAPILLVLLFRPERDLPAWEIKHQLETDYPHLYTEIKLEPLSSDEQNLLVDNILAGSDLPHNLRQLILERSEGNPLYLEEIMRSLIEQGGFVRHGDGWIVTGDIEKMSIPDTLQGLLLARIDRLEEDVRRTIQLASVIGKSFLYRLLQVIVEAEQELESHLRQLQRVDLVREKSRLPELEYVFKHSLTQEAAYNSLLVERRREFHLRVAAAIEKLFSGRREEFLGLLAHHYDAGGDSRRAADYLVQAGDRARLTDEHSESIAYYRRAYQIFDLLGDEAQAAQVCLNMGMVFHSNFQFESAHQFFHQAFVLQQKTAPLHPKSTQECNAVLRTCFLYPIVNLDPGSASWIQDISLLHNLFAGLVDLDAGLNLKPNVAHSWEVLDGGRRYLLHLRDDVFWSDGTPVTALDFEWSWKRNLSPHRNSDYIPSLYGIIGSQDFHEGRNPDPSSIGVRALNELDLEVRLLEPQAAFPFILSLPITFPLPRHNIERNGNTWWQSGRFVSNGAFRLVEFDPQSRGIIERNPRFHGEFPGNLRRVEWIVQQEVAHRLSSYVETHADVAYIGENETPLEISPAERIEMQLFNLIYLVFGVHNPPFDDIRVRRALILAINRRELGRQFGFTHSSGGLIPSNLPGHSPDIGSVFDPAIAKQLIQEAGFPGGQGFPHTIGWAPLTRLGIAAEICRQWKQNLGVEAAFDGYTPPQLSELRRQGKRPPLMIMGLIPDYPDPENILGYSGILNLLKLTGWQDEEYDQLIKNAAQTTNRVKRMAMYRQADRSLVDEQAVVLPLTYTSSNEVILCRPWVKNYQISPFGRELFQNVVVLEH